MVFLGLLKSSFFFFLSEKTFNAYLKANKNNKMPTSPFSSFVVSWVDRGEEGIVTRLGGMRKVEEAPAAQVIGNGGAFSVFPQYGRREKVASTMSPH